MKLSQLKIDPEFQSKIPPLQFEEEQQLEQNIIAEGRLLNPIITWNGYIDALFLNQDRHLNNIALIRDRSGYKPCPIFDCGASFLLDFALYSPEIESRAYLTKAQCLPFKSRFTQTVHTAQTLYGKQLAVNIDKTGIDTILDKYLCYYPKQFHFLLKERIETVLMEQQKKLFEK